MHCPVVAANCDGAIGPLFQGNDGACRTDRDSRFTRRGIQEERKQRPPVKPKAEQSGLEVCIRQIEHAPAVDRSTVEAFHLVPQSERGFEQAEAIEHGHTGRLNEKARTHRPQPRRTFKDDDLMPLAGQQTRGGGSGGSTAHDADPHGGRIADPAPPSGR